jgi:hypothetical protein
MTSRRHAAVAALLVLASAKDPRELTLELLSNRNSWAGLNMRSRSGARYECKAGEARLASQVQESQEPDRPKTLANLMAALDGQCAKLSQGWWTYEWCHRWQIRQFHAQGGKIDPDWSLGGYTITKVKGDLAVTEAPPDASLARDVFDADGQICHETKSHRASNVTFRCCEPDKRRKRRQAAYLVSVEETELCKYEVVVCSPALCVHDAPDPKNASAQELLKALDGTCLQRHEGWWSFELCYGTHARQFHVETTDVDGRKKAKVAAEFALGDRMASRRSSTNDVVVVEAVGSESARVEVEYDNGTPCDVDVDGDGVERKRSMTARFICGETNALVSIVEDRTCHYLFKVTTHVLCSHTAFITDEPTRPVTCTALDPVADDEEDEEEAYEGFWGEEDDDDDDDEEEDLPAVRGPPGLKAGARVAARWKSGLVFYPGRVVSDHGDGTYDIDYDDGDQEDNVPAALIRLQRAGE